MAKSQTVQINVRAPEALNNAIERIAERHSRTINTQVLMFLEK